MPAERSSRRAFFGEAGGCLLGLAVALGLPAGVLALPIEEIAGQASGSDRKYPVPAADAVQIDHTGQVILVRLEGRAYAFSLACPHQGAALKWVAKDNRFQCTKHDSRYQPTGVYTSGRATRNMDRFPIRREQTTLDVDVTHPIQSDHDPAAWNAASVAL
jgi:Rieske Fe-S protein